MLGGILNQYDQGAVSDWDLPGVVALKVTDAASRVSFVACTNGPDAGVTGDGFRTVINDTAGAPALTIKYDDPRLPKREGRKHQEIIPLYVSY